MGLMIPRIAVAGESTKIDSNRLRPGFRGVHQILTKEISQEQHITTYQLVVPDTLLTPRVVNTNHGSRSKSGTAYNAVLRPAASQLANFHHPGCRAFAPLISIHLTGPGIGGQFVHRPPSYSRSKLNRKNGRTSVTPDLMRLFPSRLSKAAAVAFSSALPSLGVRGWCARPAMVEISDRKCASNGSWKEAMISNSLAPEKSLGDLRLTR